MSAKGFVAIAQMPFYSYSMVNLLLKANPYYFQVNHERFSLQLLAKG